VLLVVGVLLLLLRGRLSEDAVPVPALAGRHAASGGSAPTQNPTARAGRAGQFAMGLLVVMAGANAVRAFVSTGPPPFWGRRIHPAVAKSASLVSRREELEGRVSWRGSWTIPRPDPSAADPDPAHGPLAALPTLPVQRWERITAQLDGNLTDLATFHPSDSAVGSSGRVLAVTDRFAVYVLDSAFARVLHRVVLDRGFSIDLTPLAVPPSCPAIRARHVRQQELRPAPSGHRGRQRPQWRHSSRRTAV
jgi:hypothetical protein